MKNWEVLELAERHGNGREGIMKDLCVRAKFEMFAMTL
jgi:hypothetical protein